MRRAFTLIELIIVIAAIVIIAAIAIPNLMANHPLGHYRYMIVKQSGFTFKTNDLIRLPDGVRFVDSHGNVVEVHGTYTVYDSQPQAESGR